LLLRGRKLLRHYGEKDRHRKESASSHRRSKGKRSKESQHRERQGVASDHRFSLSMPEVT
jgi:hypothetical protein